uniref:Small ribosomal subunit protein uS9c n=1 Tax=Neodangemannia microcystis TaxID=173495 RepID=A0A1W6EHI3_9CHLO|nr:ribosomal protein S9 [Neodangemannia microcystis]ARK14795.1 ribosomal protein S9 [Neodangemannia microcystis]
MNLNQNIISIGTGRRKEAVAQVKLVSGEGKLIINGKNGFNYLNKNASAILSIQGPFQLFKLQNKFDIIVKVHGSGLSAQADAIKLGVARALCEINTSYRPALKSSGYLTRDARKVERKKYGLKKARKAPQFSKR